MPQLDKATPLNRLWSCQKNNWQCLRWAKLPQTVILPKEVITVIISASDGQSYPIKQTVKRSKELLLLSVPQMGKATPLNRLWKEVKNCYYYLCLIWTKLPPQVDCDPAKRGKEFFLLLFLLPMPEVDMSIWNCCSEMTAAMYKHHHLT